MKMLTAGFNPQHMLLLSNALALLLVFRTNTAYDRFWEARQLWGFLISRIRELSRFAHSSLRGMDREHFLQLTAATPPIILQHLQSGWKGWQRIENVELKRQADRQLIGMVPKEDLSVLIHSNNRPFLVVKMLGNIIRRVYTDAAGIKAQRWSSAADIKPFDAAIINSALTVERQHAEQMLTGVLEALGGCERIVRTTVPRSYSRHTSRFLSVWCLTLPFILVDSYQWRMVPIVFLTSWALCVIEEVGHLIEDPFNMVWSGTDELKIEDSFKNTRFDVMERLPSKDRRLMQNGGDMPILQDYDVTQFHTDYIKSTRSAVATATTATSINQLPEISFT